MSQSAQDDGRRLVLTLTTAQAQAVSSALDLYTRLGIGQIEKLAELVGDGTIPLFNQNYSHDARQTASTEVFLELESRLKELKQDLLGYPGNASHGVGHSDNHISVHRSYEVYKVLRKALTDGSPRLLTVDHDGLLVRYTDDPKPEAQIREP